MVVLVQQHVRRLHVAVHERPAVGGVERPRHLAQQVQRPLRRELAVALEDRLQVLPVDEAHREVELAVVLARLVDGDHVRVVDRRGELRLAQEALAEALVLGQLGGDQLQRDGPLERQVGGAVDHAHAAATGQ